MVFSLVRTLTVPFAEIVMPEASGGTVTPGSSCIANAYSNNHDIIVAKDTGVDIRETDNHFQAQATLDPG